MMAEKTIPPVAPPHEAMPNARALLLAKYVDKTDIVGQVRRPFPIPTHIP